MRRGSIVVVQEVGTLANKARPCLIVQNETALGRTRWVTVCPITSSLTGATTIRVPIDPGEGSGLVKQSEIEVDLIFPVKFVSIDRAIGQVSSATMRMVDAALKRWLDL